MDVVLTDTVRVVREAKGGNRQAYPKHVMAGARGKADKLLQEFHVA